MKLQHIKDLPPQGDKFFRSEWRLIANGKTVYEFTHDYPAVQNPIISFKASLRRQAVKIAKELGYTYSAEDMVIIEPVSKDENMIDPATEPVDLVKMAASIMGY